MNYAIGLFAATVLITLAVLGSTINTCETEHPGDNTASYQCFKDSINSLGSHIPKKVVPL